MGKAGSKKKRPQGSSSSPVLHSLKPSLLWLLLPALLAVFYAWYSQNYHIPALWERRDTSSSSLNHSSKTIQPFEVVELEGRGKGMLATRHIRPGELLIKEQPLILVSTNLSKALMTATMDSWTPEESDSLFTLTHSRLPSSAPPSMNLDPSTQSPEEKLLLAEAIIRNNAVGLGLGLLGVFPQMARLNHACAGAFNVMYHWRSEAQELRVYALRDIQKGEELLTSYMDTRAPRDQRRAHLKEAYGFTCNCAICSLPDEASKASDENLVKMRALYPRFTTWNDGEISGPEAISIAREIWHLYDLENYNSERGQIAEEAAYVAAAHGDSRAAASWAKLAYQWATIELGFDSERATRSWAIANNPAKHHQWNARERANVGTLGDVTA